MPGPLSPSVLDAYADPRYLTRDAAAPPDPGAFGPNWMHRLGIPAMVAGQAADAGTTLAALGRPGLSEGNAFLYGSDPSAARVLATKAASVVPMSLLMDHVYDHAAPGSGTRKAALIAAIAAGALGMGLGAHNVQAMHK